MNTYKNYSLGGKPSIRANYSKDLSAECAKFSLSPDLKIGALWNAKEILFLVSAKKGSTVNIKVEDAEKTVISDGEECRAPFSFEEAGLSASDTNRQIPLFISYELDGKQAVFDGSAMLSDYASFFKYKEGDLASIQKKAFVNPELDLETLDLGMTQNVSRIHLFDRFRDGQENYMHTHVEGLISNIDGLSKSSSMILDADITVNSIPTIDYSTITGTNGGYGLIFLLSHGNGGDSLFCGIQRDEKHLFLYCNRGFLALDKTISRDFGESFHLTLVWNKGRSLEAYIDGEQIANVYYPVVARNGDFADNSLKIYWSRCHHAPRSHDDDLDIVIDNLTLSENHSESVLDKVSIDNILGNTEKQLSRAKDIYIAPERLILFDSIENKKYGTFSRVLWESSDETVLSPDGVFTAPDGFGKTVDLTMTCVSKKYIEHTQSFKFFVKGNSNDGRSYVLSPDYDPFTGVLEKEDTSIDLGSNFTSIGYDMGEITRVNRVVITSDSDIGFINKNHISLFVSGDNKSYTYVPHYTVLKKDNKLYFYNFDVKARFIKINTTTGAVGETNKNIVGSLQKMIEATFDDAPLLSTSFAKETEITVKNDSSAPVYDKLFTFTLDELNICPSELRADMGDIRFIMDGKCLPMYLSDGKFYVRVFEISGNETKIKVLYGADDAENIFDGNEVFEVQYGTKHAKNNPDGSWVNSVATMPNGDLLKIHDGPKTNGVGSLAYRRSTDGGLTWSEAIKIETSDDLSHHGGFIVDNKTGKVFYIGYHLIFKGYAQREGTLYDEDKSYCEPRILMSEDNGYTWSEPMQISGENIPIYLLSYSNGIALKDADGDGPNVDYVFTTGMMWDQNKLSFCDTAYYSRDGGKTWHLSDTKVNYTFGGDNNTFEGGMSEETVWEQEDGTLVLYARCELKHIKHFAIAHSYDHGVTWVAPKEDDLSNVYATNTQPIIESLNGTPVLMWGGQNGFGAKSHYRLPLSLAVSYDDAETFVHHVDASFQNIIATVDRKVIGNLHTNPDMTFCKYGDQDICYLVSTHHQLYVINAEEFLYKTKGAFDSFENGVEAEGWLCESGKLSVTEMGATDGKYAMLIDEALNPSRCLHHIEKGSVEFDCFVDSFGDHISFELQTAYHDQEGFSAPIRLTANSDGELFCYTAEGTDANDLKPLGIKLYAGHNHIRFDFDAEKAEATVTANGKTADMTYIENIGDVICFVTMFTGKNSKIAIDKLIAVNN